MLAGTEHQHASALDRRRDTGYSDGGRAEHVLPPAPLPDLGGAPIITSAPPGWAAQPSHNSIAKGRLGRDSRKHHVPAAL